MATDAVVSGRQSHASARVGAKSAQDLARCDTVASAGARASGPTIQIPRVARHREGLGEVGASNGVFHRRRLTHDHGAGSSQPGNDGSITLVTPRRIHGQTLRRRGPLIGAENVFDTQRNAVQRPKISALSELSIGLFGPGQRLFGVPIEPCSHLWIECIGSRVSAAYQSYRCRLT